MKKIIIFFSFCFFVWFIGLCIFAWQINNFPIQNATRTDAIIVLTGGRNRITEAVKLLEQKLAPRLFISGVAKDITLADIQKQQNLTIPDNSKIDIGHNAFNTEGNAKETSAWVKQNDIKSIRLVTSNYHINRSIIEFYKQDPNLTIVAHPVYSEKIEKKWWTSWQTFSLISKEYNKFLYIYLTQKLQED